MVQSMSKTFWLWNVGKCI